MIFTMPKNKKELIVMLSSAFKAGAEYAGCIEHSNHMNEQIQLGFDLYSDKITPDEWEKEIQKYWVT